MKRALGVVLVLGISVVGWASFAAGPRLTPTATYHYALTDCDGGVNATLPSGDYLMTVKDETTYLCVGDAGCAAGGHPFPAPLLMRQAFGANGVDTPVSCRSALSTGDIDLTLIAPGT